MTDLQFEWDDAKNASNQRKHGISFEQATFVFLDPLHISKRERVVDGEERWQTFGVIKGSLLLMVAHVLWHEEGPVVRIISARQASRRERRIYEEENG